ncbi:amidohydrolase family protein [Aestuariicella hydrocarbonica]|uniref:Amidohydrolase family protein n=1 Tax=Pseudomaricurvus hydrocarbonicus TaxID=1470433 RepID=A0A9E5MQB8_9GAMM|nr:amidohydrolase family protein [Aestuariicella hydrocarbonica]NHO68544.1 amidohydrolase family protein [Aestuariicella hydrocarbonica]
MSGLKTTKQESNTTSSSAEPVFIRGAQLLDGGLCDVRLANGLIAAKAAVLQPEHNDIIVEAQGNLLLPGLQDHHLHLFATASARASVQCGPPEVNSEQELRGALQAAPGSGWLRGFGFHDSVYSPLNRDWLDSVCPDRPVRIQHRSGMMWVLNSVALEQLSLDANDALPEGAERDSQERLSGRFYNLDAWLGEHLQRAWPSLTTLSAELASYGITGVTDTGVNNDRAVWSALQAANVRGEMLQRMLVMGSEALVECGTEQTEWLQLGPLKLYLREVDLPDLDLFSQRILSAHQQGRAVAVHCVTRVEMFFVLEAFTQAGVRPGDRIEHASIADDHVLERMSQLGLIAVTQPHFIAERGDQYCTDVDPDDLPWLYRAQSFLQQGVVLAAGSDAPYGSPDPWAAMRAAIQRTTRGGRVMGVEEQLTPHQALGLFGGTATQPGGGMRRLVAGQAADLCLLDTDWAHLSQDLHACHVAATFCDGKVIYQSADLKLKT